MSWLKQNINVYKLYLKWKTRKEKKYFFFIVLLFFFELATLPAKENGRIVAGREEF
jgi:hypothetical protein